jgi:hypothetical protein
MKTTIRIGDIYSVKMDGNTKKYFQFVAVDFTQLNSAVIRAFKTIYSIDATPELSEIIKGDIDFYVHCSIKIGIKLQFWEKVGNISDVGKVDVLFRHTNDFVKRLQDEPVKISSNWYVWKVNENIRQIGKLEGPYKNSFVGLVINPYGIIELLKGNKYPPDYPD